MKYLFFYLCITNALSFLFMLVDKARAPKNKWRIPERTLLLLCAFGGSLGGYIAMQLCRHKTKHPSFTLGIPVILAVQIVAVTALFL